MRYLRCLESRVLVATLVLLLGAFFLAPTTTQADEGDEPERARPYAVIEEITVTARHKEESLQDVPVTVAVFGEEDLDRYNIKNLNDAAKLIPNFQINQSGSGNGSNLFLRGVGSSSISAAFDQSVAMNIDGVVTNIGRFIQNAYLDMGQIEVLKGPQSLYFGKSATAGVVSITTKDPGDEFEIELMSAYEFEMDQTMAEFIISGPVTDTFGARLALGWTQTDEFWENLSPVARNKWREEEAINTRLTLVWDISEDLSARFKLHYSDYENDGNNGRAENRCVEGFKQPGNSGAAAPFIDLWDDCDHEDRKFALDDANPLLVAGIPFGGSDGVPFLEQETWIGSIQLDWDFAPELTLTSITGYSDLDHVELDVYCYCAIGDQTTGNIGFFWGMHNNIYEAFSQEFRLTSSFEGPLNFMAGFFYQDVEQEFSAFQGAANITLAVGPDPVTGNGYDYNKHHFLDTEVLSAFVAGYWSINDDLELTAGVRFTDEDKDAKIEIPYMHSFLSTFAGFIPSGTVLDDQLDFDDTNWSPEIALNWYVNDDMSTYVSYKKAYKSGGVDNSSLPTNTLNTADPSFPSALLYDSEDAAGYEVGVKSNLLDGTLRVNSTAFYYEYEDLQVQTFDSATILFNTKNAGELTTFGIEADWLWATPVEGLTVRGAIAWTDAEYTDTFLGSEENDIDGMDRERSADLAGTIGASYDVPINDNWTLGLNGDIRYSDDYLLEPCICSAKQDSFTTVAAAIRVYSSDGTWEFALLGKNLTDEIYVYSEGSRPGAVPSTPGGLQDRLGQTSLGRQITLQARYLFN